MNKSKLFLTLCISVLATSSYLNGMRSDIETTECMMCLQKFRHDEHQSRLLWCGHRFHRPCINTWLANNNTCPICRSTEEEIEEKAKKIIGKKPSRSSASRHMEIEMETDILEEMPSANRSQEILTTEEQVEVAEKLIEQINEALTSKYVGEEDNHKEMAEILSDFKKLNINIPSNNYEGDLYDDLIGVLEDEDLPDLLQSEETTRELVNDAWKLIKTIKEEKILENLIESLKLIQSSSEEQSENRSNNQSGDTSDDELFDF